MNKFYIILVVILLLVIGALTWMNFSPKKSNPLDIETTLAEQANTNKPIGTEIVYGAISMEQVDEMADQIGIIQQAASDLNEIVVKVREAILTDDEGNVIVGLTSTQKQALLNEWNTRKQVLIDAVGNLY